MSDRLAGRVAFVTGAARGQGRAHALRLASEGADLMLHDLAGPLPGVAYDSATPDDLAETVATVAGTGRRVVSHVGDVRDADDLRGFVDGAAGELGRLDIVVANAGICIPATWDEVTAEMLHDTFDINVFGVWNTVRAAVPHLIAAGGGSVIVTSSAAGRKMQPFMIPYTASKHALVGMTRGLAAELGRHRIRVNSIHPGPVSTPMGGGRMVDEITRTAASHPALTAMGGAFLPEPWMPPEAVADLVAFLASDESRFMTSEHVALDAGNQHF